MINFSNNKKENPIEMFEDIIAASMADGLVIVHSKAIFEMIVHIDELEKENKKLVRHLENVRGYLSGALDDAIEECHNALNSYDLMDKIKEEHKEK